MTTFLFAGGGTAGHVNPLLATADRLREREPDADVLVLGIAEGLEARLVPARGYELLTVPRLPFPRRPSMSMFRFPAALKASVDLTRALLRDRSVEVVVGFGGYAAAPAYLAARAEKIPFVVHEANSRPGMANRLGATFTRFVGVTFPRTRLRHARTVGMPLRLEIERLDRLAARTEGQAFFDLDPQRPTLLVTGGSTGARRINEAVYDSITAILGAGWQVLHIAGERDPLPETDLPGYHLMPYCDRMELALGVADLAVSRAGAATVSELEALGIPAVFVPYAVGNGEQRLNAAGAVDAGGALLIDDGAFTSDWVIERLVPLLSDRAWVADAGARMSTVGGLDGADHMVDLVLEARDSLSSGSTHGGSAPSDDGDSTVGLPG